jgi:hypothetical protein
LDPDLDWIWIQFGSESESEKAKTTRKKIKDFTGFDPGRLKLLAKKETKRNFMV